MTALSCTELKPSVKEHYEFHFDSFPPNSAWPEGGWSLYRITGAQIAERTIWERKDDKLEITERWPWPGFIACFASLDAVFEAIRDATK